MAMTGLLATPRTKLAKLDHLIESARAWNVARQRFDAGKHSADVRTLRPLWATLSAAEERLAMAIEDVDA